MPTWLTVVLIVLGVLIAAFAVLYYFGMRLQRKQIQQKEQMDAIAQTVSLLVIDKKKMKLTEAGFPPQVVEQTPKYARRAKVPVVKAKIGPRIMNLMCDPAVFERIPSKTECKVVISGIYISAIKSVRGKAVPPAPKKKTFGDRVKGIFSKKEKAEK